MGQGPGHPQSSVVYQDTLLNDHQEWILQEPCSRSDLLVTGYDESKSGMFCLPAQGWNREVASDAERV